MPLNNFQGGGKFEGGSAYNDYYNGGNGKQAGYWNPWNWSLFKWIFISQNNSINKNHKLIILNEPLK